MASERLLQIPRSDQAGAFVLVNVKRAGKSDLDLELVATEGDAPYVLSVRQKSLKDLKGRKRSVPDAQWTQILEYGLLSKSFLEAGDDDFRNGFEMVADVEETYMKIVFRQRIGELTKGFGSITLQQNDLQAIELFDWAGVAVIRSTELENDITALTVKYETAMDSIRRLTSQLDDLTVAKEKHEEELLAKCVLLLNEKKSKVRNQQRLLASAKMDPTKVQQLEESRTSRRNRTSTGPLRASKRKADKIPRDSDTEEDGFEKMDVDKAVEPGSDSERADVETPERSDEETTGGEEDEVPAETQVSRSTRSHGGMEIQQEAPPVRELPFSNKTTDPQPHGGDEETEDETEDDEL